MKHKIVFVSQGPAFECSPIPFYLLKQYALLDSRLADECEFVHQPLLHFGPRATKDFDDRCYQAAEDILSTAPSLIALSLYCWNTASLLKIARFCKQMAPAVRIIAGGPDTLGVGTALLEATPALDVVLSAPEGELPFRRFLAHHVCGDGDLGDVPFIRFRDDGRVIRGTGSAFAPQLDDIPSPILPYSAPELVVRFYHEDLQAVIMETSRSCPVHCAFCQYPKMERSMRYFSLERVFRELEHLREIGVKSVYFADGIFTLRKERAHEILHYFLETFTDCLVHCEVKLDILPGSLVEVCRKLNEQGRLSFGIGIQSTNAETLETMGRPCDFSKLERKTKAVFVNSTARWDLIYGLPGDVFTDLLDGMDYIFSLMPGSDVAIQPLLALPGTEYRDSANAYGLRYDPSPPYVVIRSSTFTREDMRRARVLGEVYGVFRPIFRMLYAICGRRLRSLFRDLFDESYFEYTRVHGWDDPVVHAHHFASRLRAYLFDGRFPGIGDRDRRVVNEAVDWEYLGALPEDRDIPSERLRLPTLVGSPASAAIPPAGRGEDLPIVVPSVLDAAYVYRFEHVRKVAGRLGVAPPAQDAPGDGAKYLVLAARKRILLSEHGFELLNSFHEPRTVQEGLEWLRGRSPLWSGASPADVAEIVSHYLRMGYLRPATPVTDGPAGPRPLGPPDR